MICFSAQRVTFGVALAFSIAATLPASERAIAHGAVAVRNITAGVGAGISGGVSALGGVGAATLGVSGTASGSASSMTGIGGSSATATAGGSAGGSANALGLRGDTNSTLRTNDGVGVTTAVGRDDVVRGTVTAIGADAVTFVSPKGQAVTVKLAPGDLKRLGVRVGSTIGSISHDFGHSVMLSLIAQPGSFLGNVYVGTVASATANRVEIAYRDGTQTFDGTPATLHQLQQLTGKTIALVSLDGQHVKSVLLAQTFKRLEQAQGVLAASGATAANVVASSPDHLTLQLNNGDVLAFWVKSAALGLRSDSALTLTQLGAGRVRLTSGARSATAFDADLCNKDGACVASVNGTVVTKTPTTIAVQYANGDVASFLGNTSALAAAVGSTVTVKPALANAQLSAGAQTASMTQAEVAAAGR